MSNALRTNDLKPRIGSQVFIDKDALMTIQRTIRFTFAVV